MKDDMKNEISSKTFETLIPFDGVLNKNGVSKLNNKLKKDHPALF
jgi:hypothetical protein